MIMSVLTTGLISALLLSVLQIQGRFLCSLNCKCDPDYVAAGTFGFTCDDFMLERVANSPFQDMQQGVKETIVFRLWNFDSVPISFQLDGHVLSHLDLQYPTRLDVKPGEKTDIIVNVNTNKRQPKYAPFRYAVLLTASPTGFSCSPKSAGVFLAVKPSQVMLILGVHVFKVSALIYIMCCH